MGVNPASGTVTYRNDLSMLLCNRAISLRGYVGQRILPILPVKLVEDLINQVDPGPMMEAPDTSRARGANYGEINFSIRQTTYRCKSRGLRVAIPKEDISEFTEFAVKELGSYTALMQMMNAYEKRVCDLVFNTTTWPTGSTTGHAATAVATNFSSAVPVTEVLKAKQALAGNLGPLANDGNLCCALSWYTAQNWMMSEQIRDKLGLKYKDSGPVTPTMTEQALAEALGVDEVIIGGAQYKSAGTAAAPTASNFFSDSLVAVFRRATIGSSGSEMPANRPVVCGLGATIQWNEMGQLFEVYDYEDPDTKTEKTRVDQYTDEKILVAGANYVISGN